MLKANYMKVVKCGMHVEVYQYEQPIFTGGTSKGGRNSDGKDKDKNKQDVLYRSRKKIRNLINCNSKSGRTSFLTLTFKENLQDYNIAINLYRKFIRTLGYRLNGDRGSIKYLTVPEKQKRGAWHFHTVLFDIPYVPHSELLEIWGHGSVNIKNIKDVTNVGAYVCKYLTKDMVEENRKSYLISHGLRQPETYVSSDSQKFNDVVASLDPDQEVYSCSYETYYNGKVEYSQFKLEV